MSDTAITALLEELREVDFDAWKDIRFLLGNVGMDNGPREIPLEQHIYQDLIQGCIQRAIIKKGWKYVVSNDRARQPYGQIGIPISNVRIEYQHRNYADTPAAAILAAYIETKRAMR